MEIRLQYRLSNGNWVDCDDDEYTRTEEFLNCCIENRQRSADKEWISMNRGEVIEALKSGRQLRNSPSDWYSECRCGNYADERSRRIRKAQSKIEMVKADCGCIVQKNLLMSASMGTSCPECYDYMSN